MPFEDRTAWATVLGFIGDYRPDCVIQLGHLMNLPPPGKYLGQATIELRRRELAHTADYVRRNYLARLRKVHDGPLRIIGSAASARLGAALHRKAGPDRAAATRYVERIVELDRGDAIEVFTTYPIASGWTLLYGDNVAVTGSEIPGVSALRMAKYLGLSVIVGYTLRLGKSSYTVTDADHGAAHTVTGVEIGHLIDQQHAKALNGPSHGWQHGFAILETNGSHVAAACIPLSADRATVRWAGWPQIGDATATPQPAIVARAVHGSELDPVLGSVSPAPPAVARTSVGSTVGDSAGRPGGSGSGSRADAGRPAASTSTSRAPVGVEPRRASGE